jgi:hypothetical protein
MLYESPQFAFHLLNLYKYIVAILTLAMCLEGKKGGLQYTPSADL